MSRRVLGVIGSAATVALLAAAVQSPAQAAEPTDQADRPRPPAGSTTATDPVAAEQRELNQKAVELVLAGDREVESRGGSTAVKVAPGQWVQYGLQSSDNIFTTLVEFGDQKDSRFPTAPAGPQHNQIPQPNRAVDNSTYWTADFNRQHFLDMFFADDGSESLKNLYEELSSGRYTVDGDVTDWVKVPYNEASYGETESQTDMTRFIQDGANAWYEQQKAAGKSDDEIKAYLADLRQVGPVRLRQGRRLQGSRRLHRPLPVGPRR